MQEPASRTDLGIARMRQVEPGQGAQGKRASNHLTQRTLAFVLAGGRGARLKQLTDRRAKPAVPFGGKFKIIDFALSNCVNSGVRHIAVLTQYKAQSLIRHIERGWGFLAANLGEYVDVVPAQLLMPIFDAGRTESLVRGATAQRDIALAQYERAIQAAFRDVADALAGRATLMDQLRALEVQRQAEAARLQLVQVRVDNGVGTTLELLDAERSLFAAAQAEVQTRLAEQQSRIAMYRALGGGVQ